MCLASHLAGRPLVCWSQELMGRQNNGRVNLSIEVVLVDLLRSWSKRRWRDHVLPSGASQALTGAWRGSPRPGEGYCLQQRQSSLRRPHRKVYMDLVQSSKCIMMIASHLSCFKCRKFYTNVLRIGGAILGYLFVSGQHKFRGQNF